MSYSGSGGSCLGGGQVASAAAAGGRHGCEDLLNALGLLLSQPPARRQQPLPRRLQQPQKK